MYYPRTLISVGNTRDVSTRFALPSPDITIGEAWSDLQEAYAELHSLGIRKEDARFLLPNAAETGLAMSMHYPALRYCSAMGSAVGCTADA
ncbi:MAG: FAD-dependent thymidylate synthase [Chloroflexi bacterium]|nr:FAD-dependent thymidylate synthase [Chloroflexota bacterium]